jgi:hypothetical protein
MTIARARILILGIVVTYAATVATAALTGSDMSAIVEGIARLAKIGVGLPPVSPGDLGSGGVGLPAGAATGGLY